MTKDQSGLTERRLIHGWTTNTARVKIRMATAADLPTVAELLPAAGVELDETLAVAVKDGLLGEAHRRALAGRGSEHGWSAFSRAMAEMFSARGPKDAYLAASLILVAVHDSAGVIGTVVTFPPPHVGERYVHFAGGPSKATERLMMLGAIGLTKVKGVAVHDAFRRSGVGGALLTRTRKLHFYNGYYCVYGQMPNRAGLPEFYRHHGFEVQQLGAELDLWRIFGIHGGITRGHDERVFVRWRTGVVGG